MTVTGKVAWCALMNSKARTVPSRSPERTPSRHRLGPPLLRVCRAPAEVVGLPCGAVSTRRAQPPWRWLRVTCRPARPRRGYSPRWARTRARGLEWSGRRGGARRSARGTQADRRCDVKAWDLGSGDNWKIVHGAGVTSREADTRDHVIPKCLFAPPFPPNLITVPACRTCNGLKSSDDDFLRDYLTIYIEGNESPYAWKIYEDKVRSSVRRNSSEIGRAAVTWARGGASHANAGRYLDDVVAVPLDEVRVDEMMARIIRGLFVYELGLTVPSGYVVEVKRAIAGGFEEIFNAFGRVRPKICGPLGEVFLGAYSRPPGEPLSTWWLLLFYGRVLFSVTAVRPDIAAIGTRMRGDRR